MLKLNVKYYAKKSAKKGLFLRSILPVSQKFGIDKEEAKMLGIFSGVERAKQIINKDSYNWNNASDRQDIISMAGFYQRFKNCRTQKCEGSMLLWGGRQWLRNDVLPFLKKMR